MSLREHVKAMHPKLPLRRATKDLEREHGRAHHRLMPNHYHEGVNTGPDQRPRGWRTGEDAVPR